MKKEPKAMKEFRRRLRLLMHERGLSYRGLEAVSDVPFSTIQGYCTARIVVPAVDHLMRLADALDVTVDYLVGRRDDRK